jgi:hypothetical protein
VGFLRCNRGAQRDGQIERDQRDDNEVGRRDRETDADDRRPEVERVPREPVRPGARDLASLLEMSGGPDADRLAKQCDDGTDQQRLSRGAR